MRINATELDFYEQGKKKYAKDIVPMKKSSREVIQCIKNDFNILPVIKMEQLDYLAKSKISEISNALNASKNSIIGNYQFEFYKLEKDENSRIYYRYFLDRFYGDYSIYIYHEINSDRLFSNCELFQLKLIILRGIEEEEIKSNSKEYLDYLNTYYLFEEAWSDLEK